MIIRGKIWTTKTSKISNDICFLESPLRASDRSFWNENFDKYPPTFLSHGKESFKHEQKILLKQQDIFQQIPFSNSLFSLERAFYNSLSSISKYKNMISCNSWFFQFLVFFISVVYSNIRHIYVTRSYFSRDKLSRIGKIRKNLRKNSERFFGEKANKKWIKLQIYWINIREKWSNLNIIINFQLVLKDTSQSQFER